MIQKNVLLLFLIELFFLVSIFTGFALIRSLFKPMEIITTGTELIKSKDFTSKFQEIGQKEVDRLINVYNEMIDQLREERLKLQEKTYFIEKIIHNSPTGVIIFDFDGNIEIVNPSAENYLQSTQNQLKGKQLSDIKSQLAAKLIKVEKGKPEIIPLNGNRKFRIHWLYFLDRGFTRDFILLDELTREIQQSEKNAYEKIIRVMAHEVNNSVGASNSLLHSCLNYKEQISDEDKDDFVSALSVAISRADHLNNFIKSYADVIRLPEPKFQKCNISELIENLVLLLKPKMKEQNIELNLEIDRTLSVSLDKDQMEQVVVNLLKNSIEAINKDGKINIKAGIWDKTTYLEIEDSGEGIPENEIENIFTPFFSTKEDGTGIGLTMVQEILNKHEFDYSVKSSPGGPTVFKIFLSKSKS